MTDGVRKNSDVKVNENEEKESFRQRAKKWGSTTRQNWKWQYRPRHRDLSSSAVILNENLAKANKSDFDALLRVETQIAFLNVANEIDFKTSENSPFHALNIIPDDFEECLRLKQSVKTKVLTRLKDNQSYETNKCKSGHIDSLNASIFQCSQDDHLNSEKSNNVTYHVEKECLDSKQDEFIQKHIQTSDIKKDRLLSVKRYNELKEKRKKNLPLTFSSIELGSKVGFEQSPLKCQVPVVNDLTPDYFVDSTRKTNEAVNDAFKPNKQVVIGNYIKKDQGVIQRQYAWLDRKNEKISSLKKELENAEDFNFSKPEVKSKSNWEASKVMHDKALSLYDHKEAEKKERVKIKQMHKEAFVSLKNHFSDIGSSTKPKPKNKKSDILIQSNDSSNTSPRSDFSDLVQQETVLSESKAIEYQMSELCIEEFGISPKNSDSKTLEKNSQGQIKFFDSSSTEEKGKYSVNDPKLCESNSVFRIQDDIHQSITLIIGKKRGNDQMLLLKLLFDKQEFSEESAYNWWLQNRSRLTKQFS